MLRLVQITSWGDHQSNSGRYKSSQLSHSGLYISCGMALRGVFAGGASIDRASAVTSMDRLLFALFRAASLGV
jgi:hypothetical protein